MALWLGRRGGACDMAFWLVSGGGEGGACDMALWLGMALWGIASHLRLH